jgi:hypothetical protein
VRAPASWGGALFRFAQPSLALPVSALAGDDHSRSRSRQIHIPKKLEETKISRILLTMPIQNMIALVSREMKMVHRPYVPLLMLDRMREGHDVNDAHDRGCVKK